VVIALPVPTYAVSYDGNGNTSGKRTGGCKFLSGRARGVTVKANTGSLVEDRLYICGGWKYCCGAEGGTSYAGGESFLMTAGNVTLLRQVDAANPTYGVTSKRPTTTPRGLFRQADANAYLQG